MIVVNFFQHQNMVDIFGFVPFRIDCNNICLFFFPLVRLGIILFCNQNIFPMMTFPPASLVLFCLLLISNSDGNLDP